MTGLRQTQKMPLILSLGLGCIFANSRQKQSSAVGGATNVDSRNSDEEINKQKNNESSQSRADAGRKCADAGRKCADAGRKSLALLNHGSSSFSAYQNAPRRDSAEDSDFSEEEDDEDDDDGESQSHFDTVESRNNSPAYNKNLHLPVF